MQSSLMLPILSSIEYGFLISLLSKHFISVQGYYSLSIAAGFKLNHLNYLQLLQR